MRFAFNIHGQLHFRGCGKGSEFSRWFSMAVKFMNKVDNSDDFWRLALTQNTALLLESSHTRTTVPVSY